MKRLIFVLLLFLISTFCFSQNIKVDTINYRAKVVAKYINDKKSGDLSDVLFSFRGDVIFTSIDDQRRAFYRKTKWEKIEDSEYNIYRVQCKDNGGFLLELLIGYNKPSESNFIIVKYNNITYFYEVQAEEIPVPEEELYIYQTESPDYTEEEVNEFLRQFGNPVLIKQMMIRELLFDDL